MVFAIMVLPLRATAKVVVLSNRTAKTTSAILVEAKGPAKNISLAPGDSQSFFFQNELRIRYQESRVQREFELEDSCAYFFTYGTQVGAVRLEKIGLGKEFPQADELVQPRKAPLDVPVIRVKLLVDDNEPTLPEIWQGRLRKRFLAAAEIIQRHCGIRLEIDSLATWKSDDSIVDFRQSLLEFEQAVKLRPAQLAIGFSSQYRIVHGRTHMGGTRGILFPYILLRERSPQVRETERLEMLVHELGHYLGAAHSPEPFSVMRPILTGAQQRAVGSKIRFDPVNNLLIAMVGDEIRQHGLRGLHTFPEAKKNRMVEIYRVLTKALPDDPAAARFLLRVNNTKAPPVVADTRLILAHLLEVARLRHEKSSRSSSTNNPLDTLKSRPASIQNRDETTNLYVRQAARAALRIPPERAKKAFLLALGVFFDDSNTLRGSLPTGSFVKQTESEAQQQARLPLLGNPTMQGRRDLVKHFFISAFHTATLGAQVARGMGLTHEVNDARQGTGFSFADISANQAGIIFAEHILNGKLSLKVIAQNFRGDDYLPPIDDLPENLSVENLKEQFENNGENQLNTEIDRLESIILELPAYQQ